LKGARCERADVVRFYATILAEGQDEPLSPVKSGDEWQSGLAGAVRPISATVSFFLHRKADVRTGAGRRTACLDLDTSALPSSDPSGRRLRADVAL